MGLEDDIQTIKSLLNIYFVMDKDYEFLNTKNKGFSDDFECILINRKFLVEFQAQKERKQVQLGPLRYYFESLQEFLEKRLDSLLEIFEGKRVVKYLTKVLERISQVYIGGVCENILAQGDEGGRL